MIRLEYRTYSFAVMDSLAERGWFYFEQIAGSGKDVLLQYDLLSQWAAIKLEKGETKTALELFTKAIALLQNDTRPAIRARVLKDKGNFYVRNNSLEDRQLALAPLMGSLTFYKATADPEKPEILIQLYKSI